MNLNQLKNIKTNKTDFKIRGHRLKNTLLITLQLANFSESDLAQQGVLNTLQCYPCYCYAHYLLLYTLFYSHLLLN